MSNPVKKNSAKAAATPIDPNQLQVAVGSQLLDVLRIAYRARRPVLLEGATGIGKSQIVMDAAKQLGLDYRVLDLSLLEPPDLVGLPVIDNGVTRYAVPAELPQHGQGILMLEELNRAEIPVMQPALQLLSARRLHSYTLPPGWMCVAAINPEDGEYQVNRLDPALRSRFLQVSVCADRTAWLQWAHQHAIHPVVIGLVSQHEDSFESASPRSWAYASDMLHTFTDDDWTSPTLIRIALRGYLPAAWTETAMNLISSQTATLIGLPDIESILLAQHTSNQQAKDQLSPAAPDRPRSPAFAGSLHDLAAWFSQRNNRPDAIALLSTKWRRYFASEAFVALVDSGRCTLATVETSLASLPGDFREQCLRHAVMSAAAGALLRSTGVSPEAIAHSYQSSSIRSDILRWRESMQVHRIVLVVQAVLHWLAEAVTGAETNAHIEMLATDAGPMGAELRRWLSLRGEIA
jgi:hypothetical protein